MADGLDSVDWGDWTTGDAWDFGLDATTAQMLSFMNADGTYTIASMPFNDWYAQAIGGGLTPTPFAATDTGGVASGAGVQSGGSGGAETTVTPGGGGGGTVINVGGGGGGQPWSWQDALLRAALSAGIASGGYGLSRAIVGGGTRARVPQLTPTPLTPGQSALQDFLRSPAGADLTKGLGSALTGQADLSKYLNKRLAVGAGTQELLDPAEREAARQAASDMLTYAQGGVLPGLGGQQGVEQGALAALQQYLTSGTTPATGASDRLRDRALADLNAYASRGTPIPGTEDALRISDAAGRGLLAAVQGKAMPGAEGITEARDTAIRQLNDYMRTGLVPLDPLMTDLGQYARDVLHGTYTDPQLERAYASEQEILNNEIGARGLTGQASASSPNLYARGLLASNQDIGRYNAKWNAINRIVPQYEGAITSGVSARENTAQLSDSILNRIYNQLLFAAQYGDTKARNALLDREGMVRLADEITQSVLNTATANAGRYQGAAAVRTGNELPFLNLQTPNAGLMSVIQGGLFNYPSVTGQNVRDVGQSDVQAQRRLEAEYGIASDLAKQQSRQSLADAMARIFGSAAGAAVGGYTLPA